MKSSRIYHQCSKIFNYDEIDTVIEKNLITDMSKDKNVQYYNFPCAFDIETSSFYDVVDNKTAIMYIWQLGFNGAVIIGRTWEQFMFVYNRLCERLILGENRRLAIYVHNLSYEFQFICQRFAWSDVFNIDKRKPVRALTLDGVEFRCSYLLSGYNLETLGKNLTKYKVEKKSGDLDYKILRTPLTPLNKTELGYCVNDVLVVMAYIQEEIERVGSITKLPLTKTGYVRQYVRNSCFYIDGISHQDKTSVTKYHNYKNIMKNLTLSTDEYLQLQRAFQGGFTHANVNYSGMTMYDITSYDFTSSYPSVMISEKFPMSTSTVVNITSEHDFEHYINNYCCLFDIVFNDIQATEFYENPISKSKCFHLENEKINNGRVVSASVLSTTITEQDYIIYKNFYTWSKMGVSNFRIYKRGYLPTDFVKSILKLYSDKTVLKDVADKTAEYQIAKGMLNSCYGMIVTNIMRGSVKYDNNGCWTVEQPKIDDEILKYNKAKRRFLFYPWGIWVTAYARRNLFSGILECKNDYVYSDTDSIKILNAKNHQNYIEQYNKNIITKLKIALEYHGIEPSAIEPKTIDKVKKPLGVWDYDGHYLRFKTLGAKRYMVEHDSKYMKKHPELTTPIDITVSGLNKKTCVPYLIDKYGDDIFKFFSNDLFIPPEYTGKMTHTYIDELRHGTIIDSFGTSYEYNELSSIHLSDQDYTLSISKIYADYIAERRGIIWV